MTDIKYIVLQPLTNLLLNDIGCINKFLNIKELSHIFSSYKKAHKISWNTFQKLYKDVKLILLQNETI